MQQNSGNCILDRFPRQTNPINIAIKGFECNENQKKKNETNEEMSSVSPVHGNL